jgi:transcriptional regulator with XRE-family HTH domain
MGNIFLRFWRENKGLDYSDLAGKLKITVGQYKELERGDICMSPEQADLLGRIFKVDARYFRESASQLDHYLTLKGMLDEKKKTTISFRNTEN